MGTTGLPGVSGTHHFARFRHDRLAYESVGPQDAPTVVLLHDVLFGRGMFAPTRQALAASGVAVRLVLPDARGHGASAAHSGRAYTPDDIVRELEAVLAAAEAERATLVGVGFGGTTAILAALGVPERVAAVIAVAPELPGVFATHPDPGVQLRYREAARTLHEISDAAYQGRTDHALNAWLAPRYGSDWQQRFTAEQLAAIRRNAGALSNVLTAIDASTIPPTLLGQIAVPVTVALPSNATELQREIAAQLVSTIPAAQLITLEVRPSPEPMAANRANDPLAALILRSLAAER
jgi:pimeloyl-ACP methyl ester carboxylesterase